MAIKSAEIFEKMRPMLEKSGEEVVKKVGAVYLFEIRANKEAEPVFYTVDLKNGKGIIILIKNPDKLMNGYRQDHCWKRGNC